MADWAPAPQRELPVKALCDRPSRTRPWCGRQAPGTSRCNPACRTLPLNATPRHRLKRAWALAYGSDANSGGMGPNGQPDRQNTFPLMASALASSKCIPTQPE